MIDKQLKDYRSQVADVTQQYWEIIGSGEDTGITTELLNKIDSEALTAIYEIGLEVIGQDEPLEGLTGTVRTAYNNKNFLRASQRKAWAKACGVAE